ncbi:hypothetical protein [Limnohabitans sp. Rim8]|uniref:hypothetical protein n=1 Tax=Limnohabitans sp. Rim8 TaxID=1100718 RepID=UPI0025DEB5FD|nr:hypothetical protein [Limnohabitans sp. Rim8]
MNATTEKSVLGQRPVAPALLVTTATSTSTKTLATWMLAAAVAALVVTTDILIDAWAQTHVLAAWAALWAVAVVAIAALRGVTRLMAQNLMTGLDAWSAHVARRRADQRLWAMAQTDSRMMRDLQTAMDRAENTDTPATDVTTLMSRRVARMVNSRQYYI